MANFQPGSFSAQQNYNFVSAADIVAKSYLPNQVPIYGDQLMMTLTENMGGMREVQNIITSHWEDVKIMPSITVTNSAGAAGGTVTCTLVTTSPNAQIFSETQHDPYVALAAFNAGLPVKEGDHIIFKASSNPVNASTNIQGRVMSVNKSAATFTVAPLKVADSIPANTAAQVFIAGNSYGEGTAQPDSFTVLPEEKFFNLQIFKHNFECTGTESEVKTYFGTSYRIRGEEDAYKVFLNKVELGLITGEEYDNPAISSQQNPISMTKGVIPSILEDGGYVQGYSTVTGYGINEFEALAENFDKETFAATTKYQMEAGINLSFAIDRSMADFYQNGANIYDNFGGAAAQAAALNYNKIVRGNYTFMKRTYNPFNNSQMFGTTGYSYNQESMVLPMEGGNDSKTGAYIPAMSILYLKNRGKEVSAYDGFKQSNDGQDIFQVRYRAHRGIEMFGLNRYAYIQVA